MPPVVFRAERMYSYDETISWVGSSILFQHLKFFGYAGRNTVNTRGTLLEGAVLPALAEPDQ